MLRNIVRLKRRSPTPIATENYTRIPPAYVSPYIPANSGATLHTGISFRPSFVFGDDRQGYHRTLSLAQKMVHRHTSSALTDSQPYTGDLYNQVPTPGESVQGLIQFIQSGSDFSHDCQGLNFCINAPTVPNTITGTFYNDYSTFVVLRRPPLPPPPSSELQQHIPPSSFANNDSGFFPVVCQDGSQTLNHDPEAFSLAGSSSTSEVASSSIFPQRGHGTSNAVLVPEHDHDAPINQPIVDAVPSLREGQWPPAERMYATVHMNISPDTGQYSTKSPNGPTRYDCDSLATTFEAASVSYYAQSPSPRPHTNAIQSAMSSPSSGYFADVFTSDRSHQWQYVASGESESSLEIRGSTETSPAPTAIQQSRTTNATVAGEPNFCHLCGISFTQPQVFLRHLKDKHEDKESCTHCLSFKWSRGRPYLYRRHLKLKHPQFTSSENRPGKTRKLQASGARRCKVPNRRTQATSGGLVLNLYHLVVVMTVFQDPLFNTGLAKCSSRTHFRSYCEGYWTKEGNTKFDNSTARVNLGFQKSHTEVFGE